VDIATCPFTKVAPGGVCPAHESVCQVNVTEGLVADTGIPDGEFDVRKKLWLNTEVERRSSIVSVYCDLLIFYWIEFTPKRQLLIQFFHFNA
jgi:hypothetical protein